MSQVLQSNGGGGGYVCIKYDDWPWKFRTFRKITRYTDGIPGISYVLGYQRNILPYIFHTKEIPGELKWFNKPGRHRISLLFDTSNGWLSLRSLRKRSENSSNSLTFYFLTTIIFNIYKKYATKTNIYIKRNRKMQNQIFYFHSKVYKTNLCLWIWEHRPANYRKKWK